MATESTESTDPRTPLVFGFRPHHSHCFGLALVCMLDDLQRSPGGEGRKHKRRVWLGFPWVPWPTFGGAEGAASSVDRLPEIPEA